MSLPLPLILALDPGTIYFGVAVLAGSEPQYYGVKKIGRRQSPQAVLGEITRALDNLIIRYQPACLALKKLTGIQEKSPLLVIVTAQVKAVASERNLIVYEYESATVRTRLAPHERATRHAVARILAKRFPQLTAYSQRTRLWERNYYGHLFDALALGLVCAADLAAQSTAPNEHTGKTAHQKSIFSES